MLIFMSVREEIEEMSRAWHVFPGELWGSEHTWVAHLISCSRSLLHQTPQKQVVRQFIWIWIICPSMAFILFLFCVCECFVCMYMSAPHMCAMPSEGIWFRGAGVTSACEPCCGCWESSPGPLGQQGFSTTKPALHPSDTGFTNYKGKRLMIIRTSSLWLGKNYYFSIRITLFISFCMFRVWMFRLHVYVCAPSVCIAPGDQKRASKSMELQLPTVECPCGFWKLNLCFLEDQSGIITTEPYHQPQILLFSKSISM